MTRTLNILRFKTLGLLCLLLLGAIGGAGAQVFVQDNFQDTAGTTLAAHTGGTGNIGNVWTTSGAANACVITGGNRLRSNQSGYTSYTANGVPPSADYDVVATVYYASETGNQASIIGRSASGNHVDMNIYNGTISIAAVSGGGATVVYNIGIAETFTPGQTYTLKMAFRGTTVTYYLNGTVVSTQTITGITAAGYAGAFAGGSICTDSTGFQLASFQATGSGVAAALSLSGPTGGSVGTAYSFLTSIVPTGGTSAGVIVTPSDSGGGGTFTPTSVTLSTATQSASFTYTPGSAGVKTISVSNNQSLTNPSPLSFTTAASVIVPVTSTGIFFSPYNWYFNGSQYAQTVNAGAYMKAGFTGTSCTLLIDTTPLSSAQQIGNTPLPSNKWPILRYSVDNGATTDTQIPATGSSMILASGLAGGAHTLMVSVVRLYQGNSTPPDRWGSTGVLPFDVCRITGIQIDGGASVIAPVVASGRAVFYGDSITEGVNAVSGSPDFTSIDGTATYAVDLGLALGCEYGIIGDGGSSWTKTGSGGVPGITTSWSNYSSGVSRLTNGKLTPVPDFVVSNEGVNLPPAASDVSGWLTVVRNAVSLTTKILCISEFNGLDLGISGGVTSYKTANPSDAAVFFIDPGAVAYGLHLQSYYSADHLHYNALGHAILATATMKSIIASTNALGTKRRIQ